MKTCSICGSTEFWKRADGGEVCSRCHPSPNPVKISGQYKVKFPDGSTMMIDSYTRDGIEELKARVKLGNDKLTLAWAKLSAIDHDDEAWKRGLDQWSQANAKLSEFCTQLKALGFRDCLFKEGDKKTRRCMSAKEEEQCWVCPSDTPYWDLEFR